jgi:hypothetical protein
MRSHENTKARNRSICSSANDPAHDERRGIEVEQQTDPASGSFEIGTELGKVGGVQRFDRFELNHKLALDEQVEPAHANVHSFETYRQRTLCLEVEVTMGQRHLQCIPIRRLKKSWAKRAMDINCRSNDCARQ